MGVGSSSSTHSKRGVRALTRFRTQSRKRYLAGGLTAVLAAAGLAAQDASMDILGLDVTWEAEFSGPAGSCRGPARTSSRRRRAP